MFGPWDPADGRYGTASQSSLKMPSSLAGLSGEHPLNNQANVSENIDPTGVRTDAELNDALNLIHDKSEASSSLRDKLRLDGVVQNEGANFSAGERQLRESHAQAR